MEEYSGIISLFISCIEFVLLINLLIFAEKNEINKLIIILVGLLFSYQLLEFIICYIEIQSNLIVYIAFLFLTFLPPLLLNIVLSLSRTNSSIKKLVYIPAILLAAYYPSILSEFVVTKCTIVFAAYDIPFADLYGIIYYTPVLVSIIMLIKLLIDDEYKGSRSNLIIFTAGIVFSFIPTVLIILLFPELIDYVESFLCKSAFFIALSSSVFAMRNKKKET